MKVIRIASVVAMIASGLIGSSNVVANATTTSVIPTCRSSQLTVEHGRIGAGMGHIGITAASFRNISKTSCTLKGYPSLQMYDTSGHRISTHIIHGPSASVPNIAAKVVLLRPSGVAKFDFGYANQTGYGSASCPTSARVTITPPKNVKGISANWKLQPYGGMTIAKLRCGEINVSPVYSTTKAEPIPTGTGGAVKRCAPSAVNQLASTSQKSYRLSTPVKMMASIRNSSAKSCTVVVGETSPSFLITNSSGVMVWNTCYVNGQPGACLRSSILKTLKPGERYSASATWNSQAGTPPNPIVVGTYTLTSTFSDFTTEKKVRFSLIK